ncbi:MAG: hypothetical protein L0271_17415 [Gemmatimonadetes bacterium]|nr:hypothetical protein [Gemmatimonadota bacterium]
MTAFPAATRPAYQAWVEDQIEEYKSTLTRDELLDLAEFAVERIVQSPDGQYALTEILLRDAVDALIQERLDLPGFRRWRRACLSDTGRRPIQVTDTPIRAVG